MNRLPPPPLPTCSAVDPRGEVPAVLDLLRGTREDGAVIELWYPGGGLEDWARTIAWLHDLGAVDAFTAPDGSAGPPVLDDIFDPERVFDEWEMRFHVGTSTWSTPLGDHGGVYFWGGPEDFDDEDAVATLLTWARDLAQLLDRPAILHSETPDPFSQRPLWRSDQDPPRSLAYPPACRHRASWAAPDTDLVAEFRNWVGDHRAVLEALGFEVELSPAPLPWVPGLPEGLRRLAHLQLWGAERAGELTVGEDGQLDLHVIEHRHPDDPEVITGYFDVRSSIGLFDATHALLAGLLDTATPPWLPVRRPFVTAPRHWERPADQPWPDPSQDLVGPLCPRPAPPSVALPTTHAPPGLPDAAGLPHGVTVSGRGERPPLSLAGLLRALAPWLSGAWWTVRIAEFSGHPDRVGPLTLLSDRDELISTVQLRALAAGVVMHEGLLVAISPPAPAPIVVIEHVRGDWDVYADDEAPLAVLRERHGAQDLPPT